MLRGVTLPATWSRACGIDATNPRDRLVIMAPNLDGFGFRFPPTDFDSDPVQARRRRRRWWGGG
jgi:hypothetical protein